MIKDDQITLKDGSIVEYEKSVTAFDIAKDIVWDWQG